jgi:hypothetical protein
MFIGSCFADATGSRMKEYGWDACVNPFGVLYNPSSIALACRRLLQPGLDCACSSGLSFKPEAFVESDLLAFDGMVHSFMHHSCFSADSVEAALDKMNSALTFASTFVLTCSRIVISFGTASVYRLKSDGRTVANCHKLPASHFDRVLLTVDRIVDEWSALLKAIRLVNPSVKVIFTVSPIRHWKDGAHANQISKSTLLLAEQALVEKYADRVSYFPAYELMMDELRDYRFYGDDMLHPSKQAIAYIWERFCDTYMDAVTKEEIKEVESIRRDLFHRPFNPASDAYKRFLMQTLEKIKRLQQKNPYICIPNEEKEIKNRLQNLS